MIEAEHLLLALAGDQGGAAQQVLSGAGLDRGAIHAALAAEFTRSLAAAGVSWSGSGMPRSAADPGHQIGLGSSAKWAVRRAAAAAKAGQDSRIGPLHLLIGILRADVGTVPRALELAGIDRTDLVARAEQAA